jgi:hypothetical protein
VIQPETLTPPDGAHGLKDGRPGARRRETAFEPAIIASIKTVFTL